MRGHVELLERRRLLSIVVDTVLDGAVNGATSLREAIATANASQSPQTIVFSPTVFSTPKTITLNGNRLDLSRSATITGPAAGVTIDGAAKSRVLQIDAGATANISKVNFTNGIGGINNLGTLYLANSTVSNNRTTDDAAGIRTFETAHLTNVAVMGNSTTSQSAGGVGGAGILTMLDCTVANNRAINCTGVHFTGAMALTNVTIAGNVASGAVAGICIEQTAWSVSLVNVTIAGNSAGAIVGGLSCKTPGATIANTVIAGNTNYKSLAYVDVKGALTSRGHNFIGQAEGSTGWIGSDYYGNITNPLDPKLGKLTNWGGPTQTMLPLQTSPLIDHGSNALVPASLTTDQRGQPRIDDGIVDIGAAESRMGQISGTLFNDANGDRIREAKESCMGACMVYLDFNGNGKLDAGEKKCASDVNGKWSFNCLQAGMYVVRVAPVQGYAPAGSLSVGLAIGTKATGLWIGDRPIA
jgi:hypothetical protein